MTQPTIGPPIKLDPSANGTSSSDQPIWLGAAAMDSVSTPANLTGQVGTTGPPAWMMDAATQERVSGTVVIPSGWATVNVDLYWANSGAGAGAAVFQCQSFTTFTAGDTLASVSTGAITGTASADDVVVVTRLQTGLAVVGGEPLGLTTSRRGDLAGDTLPNDLGVLGLLITKAS